MDDFKTIFQHYINTSSTNIGMSISEEYIESIEQTSDTVDSLFQKLICDLNAFEGNDKSPLILKGDVAEFF